MKTEAEMDAASRPLREAANEWARERGSGFSGGWCAKERVWHYRFSEPAPSRDLTVEIVEDGSEARVRLQSFAARATTPRGLRAVLSKAINAEYANER